MYSARITRLNPTAFIFLIDQSGSMDEKMTFGSSVMTKAEAVAMVTNTLIRELINRCHREEGILDYFDIAAIGYSQDEAAMLLGAGDRFAKPSDLAMRPCNKRSFTRERILPNGSSVVSSDELSYWIEPKAEGSTPMRSALEQALLLAGNWCRKPANAASYPPTIFNITDGEASDGDYEILNNIASRIKSLHTDDGNVLLININLAGGTGAGSVLFPASAEELPVSKYSHMLFEMSSVMPAEYNEPIIRLRAGAGWSYGSADADGDGGGAQSNGSEYGNGGNGGNVNANRGDGDCGDDAPGARFRGMSFNTSAAALISMLNVGSRSMDKM